MKLFAGNIFAKKFSGSGNAYVIAIIGAVAAGSFFLTGGIMPQIDRNPINPQHVEIDDTTVAVQQDSLQLINIEAKPSPTITPRVVSPTQTPAPTGQPTPTPPTACLNNMAINLLIDTSSSMNDSSKLQALRDALGDFANSGISDDTVIGAQKFGGNSISEDGLTGVDTIFNFVRFGDDKNRITSLLESISANTGSGTYTRNGFRLALRKISAAQASTSPFKNYKYITIVFTDGVPEVSGHWGSQCVVAAGDPQADYKCFAKDQDPRGALIGGTQTADYVNQMDTRTDKTYGIAIYNSDPNTLEGQVSGELVKLMQTIAGSTRSPRYLAIDLDNGNVGSLIGYFKRISGSICN